MSAQLWNEVDDYFVDALHETDEILDAALADSVAAGLPAIQVSAPLGRLLALIARIHGARRILEVGTLGGYSTIWLARELPAGGRLISLEIDETHAEVARGNLERAGLTEVAEVRIGPALESLAALESECSEPFDLAFIDADKQSNAEYFEAALRMSHPGSVIIVDNVVRNGAVIETDSTNEQVQGVRRLVEVMRRESRITATALQTVGAKGYDGFAIAIVR